MGIETTKLKRCDLLRLEGRFDSSTAQEIEDALKASMEDGVYRIVLGMEGVDYFGSSAMRALIMGYKECRRRNRGDVRLCCLPERVSHVLDLAGILPLVQVYDTEVEAVGSF